MVCDGAEWPVIVLFLAVFSDPIEDIALKQLLRAGVTRTTFRVLSGPMSELEKQLRLNLPALLIRSAQEIKGTLFHYSLIRTEALTSSRSRCENSVPSSHSLLLLVRRLLGLGL